MEEKKEEVKNAAAPNDPATAAELAKVRSSNKILKIAAVVLSVLFMLILSGALFVYHKLSGFKDLLLPSLETSENSAFRAGEESLPGTLPESLKQFAVSTQNQSGSSLTVFTNASEYAQAAAPITADDGEKAARVLAKYADRAIVKDFLAELKKDPDFARALREKDANNPLVMIASVQKTKSMQGLTLKFAMRKDFMPLMMEVMNDPDMKPLLSKLPMGNMGPGAQMLKMMPGAAQSPAPVVVQPEYDAAAGIGIGESAHLDSSVMQSPVPASTTKLEKKAPPLPGD